MLDALAAEPLTDAALADRLTLNRGNLRYRLLPRLAAFELIVRADDGWHLVENLDTALEAAADALGLTGKADTVAAQHAAERAAYLDHRKRTRPPRDAATRRRLADSIAACRNTGACTKPFRGFRASLSPGAPHMRGANHQLGALHDYGGAHFIG